MNPVLPWTLVPCSEKGRGGRGRAASGGEWTWRWGYSSNGSSGFGGGSKDGDLHGTHAPEMAGDIPAVWDTGTQRNWAPGGEEWPLPLFCACWMIPCRRRGDLAEEQPMKVSYAQTHINDSRVPSISQSRLSTQTWSWEAERAKIPFLLSSFSSSSLLSFCNKTLLKYAWGNEMELNQHL